MSTAERFKNDTLQLFSDIKQDLKSEWEGEEPGINFFMLLGVLLVCIVYIVFVTFYFSRVVGSILAVLISRFLQWRLGSSSVKVRIGSFSISVLAGKIMFRNVSFTDDDMCIHANDGWVIFSYWSLVPGKIPPPKAMNSSRLHISLNGFKIHFYNRTSLYRKALKTTGSSVAAQALSEILGEDISLTPAAKQRALRHQPPPDKLDEWWDNFWRLSGFIRVDISSGRVICGNHLMPTAFATVFENLQSKIYLTKASNDQDRCMLKSETSMENVRVSLVKSNGYMGDGFEDPPRTMGEGFAVLQSAMITCFYHQDLLGLVQAEVQSQVEDVPVWESVWRLDSNTVFSYGPWADKQREELYSFFYPPEYSTAPVTEMPKKGQRRIYLQHDVRVSLLKEATIDIWFMRAEELNYVHTGVKQGSSFEFTVPWITTEQGFVTNFKGCLLCMESTTSLPLRNFIDCETMRFNVSVQYPRTFNALQKWHLSLELHKISTWIVWDHKRFFTDLINAWTASSKSDLCKFVPYTWSFSINVIDKFEVLLLLNDKNWVDTSSTVTTENVLAAIVGNQLSGSFTLPFVDFASETVPIDFEFRARDQLALRIKIPPQAPTEPVFTALHKSANYKLFNERSRVAFGSSVEWIEIWRTESINLQCNYVFHPIASYVESDLTEKFLLSWLPPPTDHPAKLEPDQLKLDMGISDSEVLLSGIIIKLIIDLKDNYFGSYDQMSDVATKPLHSARMKIREQLPPVNYRTMDVQFGLKVFNIKAHCLNHSQQIDMKGPEQCPLVVTEELAVELKKVHHECLVQVFVGPVAGYFYPSESFDDVKEGIVSLSAFQFRGHGLYSDVEVPWEVEIVEYAWLMEIIVGKISARIHPVQLISLIQFIDTLLVLALNEDEKLEVPDRLDLCQHFENIKHCGRPVVTPTGDPRPFQKNCQSSETLKYKLLRVSADSCDLFIMDRRTALHASADYFKLSFCNAHCGSFYENLVISLPSVKLKQFTKVPEKSIWLESGFVKIREISIDLQIPISDSKIYLLEERKIFLQKHDRALPRLYFLWEKLPKRCGCFGASRFFGERDKNGQQFLLEPLAEYSIPQLTQHGEQPGFLQSVLFPDSYGIALKTLVEVFASEGPPEVIRRESNSSYVSAKSEQTPPSAMMDYTNFLSNYVIEYLSGDAPEPNSGYPVAQWIVDNRIKSFKISEGVSDVNLIKKDLTPSSSMSPISPGNRLQKFSTEVASEADWGREPTSIYVRGQLGESFRIFITPLAVEGMEHLLSSVSDYLKTVHPAYFLQGIYDRCSSKHHKQPLTSSIMKKKDGFMRTKGVHVKLALPGFQLATFQSHFETSKAESDASISIFASEKSQLIAKTTNKPGEERKMIFQWQLKQTQFQILHVVERQRFDSVYNKIPVNYFTNWESLVMNSKAIMGTKVKPILDLSLPTIESKLVVCNLLKKNMNAAQLDKLEVNIPSIHIQSVLGKPLNGEDPSKEASFYEVLSASINSWIYSSLKISKTIERVLRETEEWRELSIIRVLADTLDWHDVQLQVPERASVLGDVKLYYRNFSSCPSCKLMLILLKFISREEEEKLYYERTVSGRDKFPDSKTRKTAMISLLSHWQTVICNQINLADHAVAEKYKCAVELTEVEEVTPTEEEKPKDENLQTQPLLSITNDSPDKQINSSRRASDNLTPRNKPFQPGHRRGASAATSIGGSENQPMDLYHWILKAHKEYKERKDTTTSSASQKNVEDVNAMELTLSVFFWSFYSELELESARLDIFPKIHFGLIFTLNLNSIKVDVIEKKLLMSPRNEMFVALTCHHLMSLEAFELSGRLYYEINFDDLELNPVQAAVDLKYEAKITNIELVVALASVSFINDLTMAIITCQAAINDSKQVLKKSTSSKSLPVPKKPDNKEVHEEGMSAPTLSNASEDLDHEDEEIDWTESVLDKLYAYQRSKFHASSKRQDLLQTHFDGSWHIKTVMLESVLTDLIVSMNLMKIDGNHEHFRDNFSSGSILIPPPKSPEARSKRHSFIAMTSATAIKNVKPVLDHCTMSMKKASLIVSEHVGSNRGAVETKRILSCSLRESNVFFERTRKKEHQKVNNFLKVTLGEIEGNLPMHAQSIHEVVLRHGPQLNEQLHRIVSQPQPYTPMHEQIGVTGERSTAIAAEPSTSNLILSKTPSKKRKSKHIRQPSIGIANLSAIPTRPQMEIEFELKLIGLELNAMLLPSLRAKYRLDLATATGTSGDAASFAAEMPAHQLLFQVVKPADEGTSIAPAPVDTFTLPLPKIKASGNYQSAKVAAAKSPELLHRYRNPLLQFREGGYFDVELVIGNMEYMFSTDLLNQILFAEQSFRSELSFLLEKLSVERPASMTTAPVFSDPSPFLFNLTFRGEGEPWVQLTASTPSRTAIRFTIDGPNATITNRLMLNSSGNQEVPFQEQLFLGKASVQVNVKLGQLFKTAMYEEAPEELQEVATFMTNISVQNEESSHVAPHNYVVSLNRPILLLKSTALDKAILLWLNYRNVHNYWREERQRLLTLNRPKLRAPEKPEAPVTSPPKKNIQNTSGVAPTDINLNLSLSIQNGLYVCVPLYSPELSDNLAAVVISLQKSDVTVCIKKELACNANFDGFRVNFIDNFDEHSLREPWMQDGSGSEAVHTNFFYFPHGSYKLCSSAASAKDSSESAKWYLSVKSQMKGMIIDFDPRIGKLMSLFAHTLSSIGSNDEGAEDYEPSEMSAVVYDHDQRQTGGEEEEALDDETNKEFRNVVGHENKVRWLERKMHEQSMLVADLSSYGVCAPSVEVERRKLRVLELMRFKEFRQTMLEKLKRKTTTVVAGKPKPGAQTRSAPELKTTFLQPSANPIGEKRSSVESTTSIPETEGEKDGTKAASSIDESVDMNIDVQINIESGQCILRANPSSSSGVGGSTAQTLAKRPSARDLKKNFAGKELCMTKLSIPSVDVKVFYTSNDPAASTPENIKNIFKEQMKLRKAKNNCFYLALELASMPDETLVTPNLADFLEQMIEPLPENLFETAKQESENSSESAAVPIVTLDTSSLPLDVLFHMVVQSSRVRFEGQQQKSSAADCLLKLPRLALMASTRKFNEQATAVGGIYLSATLSAFSLNIYSPHQQATAHDALSLTLDKLSVTASRKKSPSDEEKNKVQLVTVFNVGAANFNYDMRRLSELLAFPKPWYRKVLVRRLFFGDQAMMMKKDSTESSQIAISTGKEGKRISIVKPNKSKEQHDWAASWVFTMQWQELNIHAQMSNTMGNTSWLARRGLLRGHLQLSPRRRRDMAVTFKLLSSELSAQGGAISGEISISKLLISARHSRIEEKAPGNIANLEFKQIETRMEWMSRPIFIGKFVDPRIVLTDEWRYNVDGKGNITESTCLMNVKGSWTDLQTIITKATVDDMIKITKKLESFFGEQLKNSRLMWEAELEQQRREAMKRRLSLDLDAEQINMKREQSEVSLSSTISGLSSIPSKSPDADNYLDSHWQRVLELITEIQLKKTFFPLPTTLEGVTLTGGTIELEAKSISIACMNGEMSAPNWGLFHMRDAGVDVRNTAKYTYLDNQSTQVGINMEQKLILRLGGSTSGSDNRECKAVVCRVQQGRNFMIRNNATIEMWLESMIGDALRQLPLFADPKHPPVHGHNVLELFQFPALEAILTTIQNQEHDGLGNYPEVVESTFVSEFHSSVCVQTDFNAQVGFLPDLLKSYTKSSSDGPGLSEERAKPRELTVQFEDRRDPRNYKCLRWVVDPKIRFIDRFKWNPPVIDEILRKLQATKSELTYGMPLVEPKFVSSSPVLMTGTEFRRHSGDSCSTATRCVHPLPDIPPVKRKFLLNKKRQSIDSQQLSWINGGSVQKFPAGTETEVLKSFLATVDDEVSVPQGSLVSAMYKDTTGQWIYVKRADGQQGFVPDVICNLLVAVEPVEDEPPEKPKISRRKSQQIKRELKKFHKREFEKRAEAMLQHVNSTSDGSNNSKLPHRFGSSVGYPTKFFKTASMDRLHQKPRKARNPTGSISAATAQAIAAVAADRNRKHYLSQSGLVTLERAKPRRLPTAAERQFAMNENLRRFLSSLPEFPLPPDDLEMEEERVNETTIEQDEDSDSRPVAEGKNILFEAKSGSQPNLNENNDDYEEETIKNRKQSNLSNSSPNFMADLGLLPARPKPPPRPSATLSRLQTSSKITHSSSIQRQRRATTTAIAVATASLARSGNNWRPAEPVVHELIAIQDFRAETKIDLDVRRGDRLTTVFSAVNGWIWATHLRTKSQGFVPSSTVMLSSEFS
ncbi:hypothetical protein FO519_001495 [Halicephalobus sp. NKZ332]|nr:hypothetical protein FO519_001495 [Halicephalobus sp. NKZ332]